MVSADDNDGSVVLPDGVTKPENVAGGGLTENMAGTYFYMDNMNENGTGYTALGTTKTARYVRVYSDSPEADQELMLMELGIYGYRTEEGVKSKQSRGSGRSLIMKNR